MRLVFGASGTDCSCSLFCLLTTSVTPPSMINILVDSQRLLGTLDTQNWQGLERRIAVRPVFAAILTMGHGAGLLRGVDANHVNFTGNCWSLKRVQTVCMANFRSSFLRNLWRDLRAGLRRDPAVVLQSLGLTEPKERSFSYFSWSNWMTSNSTVNPRSLISTCTTTFSLVEKQFPVKSPSFVSLGECVYCKFLWMDENYNRTTPDYKREEGLSGSPLCLVSGTSCSNGR